MYCLLLRPALPSDGDPESQLPESLFKQTSSDFTGREALIGVSRRGVRMRPDQLARAVHDLVADPLSRLAGALGRCPRCRGIGSQEGTAR